jgi:hypothetical protein
MLIETPNLYEIRQQGVSFINSHSLFPTFTTTNASAIATGHYLGDTRSIQLMLAFLSKVPVTAQFLF